MSAWIVVAVDHDALHSTGIDPNRSTDDLVRHVDAHVLHGLVHQPAHVRSRVDIGCSARSTTVTDNPWRTIASAISIPM